jgi:serine/threonine protein kinase
MDQLLDQVLYNRYYIQSSFSRETGRRTFLANDLQTKSPVIVKLLLFNPDFTWDALKLFEREAETLKSLDHLAIPRHLDFFEVDTELGKGFALVQSYIEARSLQDWIRSGRTFLEEDLKAIAQELLGILDYLHSHQPPVIHRDIKPSNILLSDRSGNSFGQVYLIDFGAVQIAEHGGTVTVVGTYGYMAPEQFGGRTTPASDLYGLGSTLLHLLTGVHPADLPTRNGRIRFEDDCLASEQFQTWLRYMVHPDVSQRFKSARSALEALQQNHLILPPQSIRSKPSGSSVILTKTDEKLEITIPPLPLGQSLRPLARLSGITASVCIPLLLVLHSSAIGLFIISLILLWLLFPSWKRVIYVIFVKNHLSIDQKEICLTSNWLGFQKSRSSPTQDIIKLERLHYETLNNFQGSTELKVRYSALTVWAGNQRYTLEEFNREGKERQLTEIEIDWLAAELSDWLDLPIQNADLLTVSKHQNQPLSVETNVESNSVKQTANAAEIPSANQRPSLSTRQPSFKIQLETTPAHLKIKVPSSQISFKLPFSSQHQLLNRLLEYPLLKKVGIAVRRFGGLSFTFISVILFTTGLGKWIFLLPLMALLLFFHLLLIYMIGWTILNIIHNLLSKKRRSEFYNILFSLTDSSIFISLSDSKNSVIFLRLVLNSISVGYSQVPKYSLNFNCYSCNSTNSFHITGNRAEVQWLCDELNEWTGLEIRYLEPTCEK